MDKLKTNKIGSLWIFIVVAISYIFIVNADTFDLPENIFDNLWGVSIIISVIAGCLCLLSFFALILLVVRLIKRQHPGRKVIWNLFIGALVIVDLIFVRTFLLEIAKDRTIGKTEPIIIAINQYHTDSGNYPADLDSLVPLYIEVLPKPSSRSWSEFRYENHDTTYQLYFTQWVSGRIYRSFEYTPIENVTTPEYAKSGIRDTDIKYWRYFYY